MRDTGLTAFLRRTGIGRRLWIGNLIISIVPIAAVCLALYLMFYSSMTNRIESYERRFVSQTSRGIAQNAAAVIDASIEIAYSTSFQAMIEDMTDKEDWSFHSSRREATRACGRRFASNADILSVNFYVKPDKYYALYSNSLYGTVYSPEFMSDVISRAEAGRGQCVWTYIYAGDKAENSSAYEIPSEFLLSRTVTNLSSGYASGTLCIRLNPNFLSAAYTGAYQEREENARVFILDEDGRVVCADSEDQRFISMFIGKGLPPVQSEPSSGTIEIASQKYLAVWQETGLDGWRLFSLVPYDFILSDVRDMGRAVILVCVLCVLASFLISSRIARSITSPLDRITEYTRCVAKGDFSRTLADGGGDEIRYVADSFEKTVQSLSLLIDQAKESEKEKARLEFNALQAQINPHFLSNALNTISYYARLYANRNIEEIASSLTNILLVTMGKGQTIITISRELEYVRDYLLIQSYRYTGNYEARFEVDEDIQSYLIPKFILQPIVENALIHGVAPLKDRKGEIAIRGFRVGKDIHMLVSDNGGGILPDRLKEIFRADIPDENRMNHIGVANVYKRLLLMYGDGYGISAESVPDVYTKFTIVIPAMKGCEENENGCDS